MDIIMMANNGKLLNSKSRNDTWQKGFEKVKDVEALGAFKNTTNTHLPTTVSHSPELRSPHRRRLHEALVPIYESIVQLSQGGTIELVGLEDLSEEPYVSWHLEVYKRYRVGFLSLKLIRSGNDGIGMWDCGKEMKCDEWFSITRNQFDGSRIDSLDQNSSKSSNILTTEPIRFIIESIRFWTGTKL
ncbi:hypothetical protein PIB30_033801 [Stylosanthes scabra]|uniref:Uncharacterized protein n=1 Tax=Stylosanthes scabra TaxID=79078 RepID=A0ABU6WCI4_9FABA|nr:hypothetical protein [Stylosanthes scabra]